MVNWIDVIKACNFCRESHTKCVYPDCHRKILEDKIRCPNIQKDTS
jgi:hypothetical protein